MEAGVLGFVVKHTKHFTKEATKYIEGATFIRPTSTVNIKRLKMQRKKNKERGKTWWRYHDKYTERHKE